MSTPSRFARSALFAVSLSACGEASAPSDAAPSDVFPNRRTTFEPDGRYLGYVANRFSDDVSVIDLDALVELGRAPLGRDPVDTDGPRHLAIDRERGFAYAVLSYPLSTSGPHATEHGRQGRSGYLVAYSLLDFAPAGELRLEQTPTDVTLSGDGATLAISHYDEARALTPSSDIEARRAAIALVDPSFASGGDVAAHFMNVCVAPAGLVYGKDASRVYVACTGEDSLAVVDTREARVLSRVPAGGLVANKPYALAADATRERLLLTNQVARSVVVFSMNDAPVPLATTFLGGIPFGTTWLEGSRFVVALQDPDGAALVDAATGAVVAERRYAREECQKPSEPRSVDAERLFLVCEGDHYGAGRLVRLDPGTLAVSAGVALGRYPDRLAVLPP